MPRACTTGNYQSFVVQINRFRLRPARHQAPALGRAWDADAGGYAGGRDDGRPRFWESLPKKLELLLGKVGDTVPIDRGGRGLCVVIFSA